MSNNGALVLKFGTDFADAQRSIASFAVNAAANLANLGMKALEAKKTFDTLSQSYASLRSISVSSLALTAAGALAGFEALKLTIEAVVAQLDQLDHIAQTSKSLGVSGTFFQVWTDQAAKLGLTVKELESALSQAQQAARPSFGDNGSLQTNSFLKIADQLQNGRGIVTNSYQALKDAPIGDAEAQSRAVVLLVQDLQRAADTTGDLRLKAQAVEVAMQQWGPAGRSISDAIQAGKFDIDQLTKAAQDGGAMFSEGLVARSRDLKQELDEVNQRLSDAMHPALETLVGDAQQFQATWVLIKTAIAEAVEGANKLIGVLGSAGSSLQSYLDKNLAPWLRSNGLIESQETVSRQIAAAGLNHPGAFGGLTKAQMDAYNALGNPDFGSQTTGVPTPSPNTPLPVRRPSLFDLSHPATQPSKPASSSETDQIQTYIDSLQKASAAEEAEAASLGKSNQAKTEAINLAKAKAIADANGKEVTAAQTAEIIKYSDAQVAAKAKIDQFNQSQQQAKATAELFGQSLESAVEKLATHSGTLKDALTGIVQALEKAAIQALILGQGPLASLFGTAAPASATGVASVGGLFGSLVNAGSSSLFGNLLKGGGLFSGFFADGGTIPSGKFGIAGEAGPEIIMGPSTVTPMGLINGALNGGSGAGGAQVTHAPTYNIMPSGGVTPGQLAAVIDRNNQQFARNLPGLIAKAQQRY